VKLKESEKEMESRSRSSRHLPVKESLDSCQCVALSSTELFHNSHLL